MGLGQPRPRPRCYLGEEELRLEPAHLIVRCLPGRRHREAGMSRSGFGLGA